MNKLLCIVSAPVVTRSGYGSHARDIVHSLLDIHGDDWDIRILSQAWGNTPQNALNPDSPRDKRILDIILEEPQIERQPDVWIQVTVPNEFQPMGKFNIGVTAGLECTLHPPEWIQGLNRMDLIITPSNFTKERLETVQFSNKDKKTGEVLQTLAMQKPVEVLFEGADTSIYKKKKEIDTTLRKSINEIVKESYAFLFVGHWLQGDLGHDRKDLGMLIKTFFETFKNKDKAPALILKTSHATFSILDREDVLEKIRQIKDSVDAEKLPNVYLLHGDLTDEEMNDLYNHPKVKTHITFTHGEGFGRPLLEATFSEKPVIAPNWSGHVDFLDSKHCMLLPGGLVDVPKGSLMKGMRVNGTKWFCVNYNYASNVMNDVFQNYTKYTNNSLKQFAMMNKGKFSLDAMNRKFKGILEKYLPEFKEEVKLNLPTLKPVGGEKKPSEKAPPMKMQLPQLKKV